MVKDLKQWSRIVDKLIDNIHIVCTYVYVRVRVYIELHSEREQLFQHGNINHSATSSMTWNHFNNSSYDDRNWEYTRVRTH